MVSSRCKPDVTKLQSNQKFKSSPWSIVIRWGIKMVSKVPQRLFLGGWNMLVILSPETATAKSKMKDRHRNEALLAPLLQKHSTLLINHSLLKSYIASVEYHELCKPQHWWHIGDESLKGTNSIFGIKVNRNQTYWRLYFADNCCKLLYQWNLYKNYLPFLAYPQLPVHVELSRLRVSNASWVISQFSLNFVLNIFLIICLSISH